MGPEPVSLVYASILPSRDMQEKATRSGLPINDPRADELRAQYQAIYPGAELPVPVDSIAVDLLGLYVEEAEIECSGMLLPAERRVIVRSDEPEARRRFTLAHELGHWVCQHLQGKTAPVYCRASDIAPEADRLLEREANVFAAELLMPEEAVRTLHGANDLATRFGVSAEAMSWRLYNFGLSDKRPG
jgi:IrrE N-terminal-like domain